jgi:putative toxin-antitoxin system antitoxin component (TIGR02293 family)
MILKNKNTNYIIEEKSPSVVSEPAMAYGYSKTFDRNYLLENLAQSSMALFDVLLKKSNLTIKFLAENIFEITPKTFIKYKNTNTILPSRLAELAIELASLFDLGTDVFGNVNEFNSWLEANNPFLKNKKPSDFLNTSTGISLIRDALKRIEFGATA